MNQIDVSSWEECLERFRALEDEHIKRREQAPGHVSPFLYRGQPCSDWGLTTTLERSSRGNLSLLQYYRLISAVRPHIEALTGQEWRVPSLPDYEDWLSRQHHMMVAPEGYDYMIYLRHHGFPSPLLDWTRSPYIAAHSCPN